MFNPIEKELSKKQIILILVGIAVFAVLLSFFRFGIDGVISQKASLIISFDSAHKRMFQGNVEKNISVLQALDASSKAGNFNFSYSIGKSGGVILYSIDDRINEVDKKWSFYINGKPIDSSSISIINIERNDLIEAKYE